MSDSPWPGLLVPSHLEDVAIRFLGSEGSADTVTFHNRQSQVFVMTGIDVAEQFPAAGDTCDIYFMQGSTAQGSIWGQGVGTGHVGTFVANWRGLLPFYPNQGLRFQSVAGGGGSVGVWQWIVTGYWWSGDSHFGWSSG